MTKRLNKGHGLLFQCMGVEEPWPEGAFNVVSMIDVIHHVPPSHQREVVESATARVPPGGRFLDKDMVARPLWRGFANRLHDLILARQWIHYVPVDRVDRVIEWADKSGLRLVDRRVVNTFWYVHEFAIFQRADTNETERMVAT